MMSKKFDPFRGASPKKYATLWLDGSQEPDRIGFVTELDYLNATDDKIMNEIFHNYEVALRNRLNAVQAQLDRLSSVRQSSMRDHYILSVESDAIFD